MDHRKVIDLKNFDFWSSWSSVTMLPHILFNWLTIPLKANRGHDKKKNSCDSTMPLKTPWSCTGTGSRFQCHCGAWLSGVWLCGVIDTTEPVRFCLKYKNRLEISSKPEFLNTKDLDNESRFQQVLIIWKSVSEIFRTASL